MGFANRWQVISDGRFRRRDGLEGFDGYDAPDGMLPNFDLLDPLRGRDRMCGLLRLPHRYLKARQPAGIRPETR